MPYCLLTDDKPEHSFYPTSEDSWCRYQKALAKNEPIPKHKPKIPRDLVKYVRPVFFQVV